jgi:protein TonB
MERSDVRSTSWPGQVLYGRQELRKVLQRNYLKGLAVSVFLHTLILSSYYLVAYLGAEEEIPTVRVRVFKYSELGPPPSLNPVHVPPAVGVAAVAKPSVGMPVPVPDAEVSPEQTIATQEEMSMNPSPALEELSSGEQFEVTGDIVIDGDDEPGMDEFIPVEKPPQIVRKAMPEYPEMAVRAGLEGVVWVKILVDKEGKPQKAVVIKSSAELFNDPAIAAAMQFLFTPAVMNQGPVKVWVSIPFRFQLKDARVPS